MFYGNNFKMMLDAMASVANKNGNKELSSKMSDLSLAIDDCDDSKNIVRSCGLRWEEHAESTDRTDRVASSMTVSGDQFRFSNFGKITVGDLHSVSGDITNQGLMPNIDKVEFTVIPVGSSQRCRIRITHIVKDDKPRMYEIVQRWFLNNSTDGVLNIPHDDVTSGVRAAKRAT